MKMKGILKPRPHARIITMIGNQLIRNEKVALMELLKNSYDADASWVQIRFINFDQKGKDSDLKINQNSIIEIEDNGLGMSFDIIEKSWINPASPYKFLLKKEGKEKTKKGRIIQGEKGIGRFAVYKLGDTIEIITRSSQKNSEEIYLKSDLSIYDSELIGLKKTKKKDSLFIDEIEYNYERRKAKEIIEKKISIYKTKLNRPAHGTLIRVTNLTGLWSLDKIKQIFEDSLKLMSPYNKTDFTCHIMLNGKTIFSAFEEDRLDDILSMSTVRMEGSINKKGDLTYTLGNRKREYKVLLKNLISDSEVKEQFYDKEQDILRAPECGPFKFRFHVFDITRKASLELPLNSKDIEIIKSHRIYLYRDGVRIYPYGDPSDDWIELDIKRGTKRAGAYLSNDQVVGHVAISNKANPALRDKTNREGLMDIGYAYDDLRVLILGILGLLKSEFQKDREQRSKRKGFLQEEPKVDEDIQSLHKHLKSKKDEKGSKLIRRLDKNYKKEKEILNERVEIVEDLAAVGISVDAASHDLVIMIKRVKETLNLLFKISNNNNIDTKSVREVLEKLRGQFAFIEDQLHGIQPLFRSSRRRSKNLRISEIINKVKTYYIVPINDRKIKVLVEEKGPPLVVKCSEGILLQAFINLFDNSVYWLTTSGHLKKEIKIVINGNKSEVIFADNGPGVKKDDAEFIFKPFFTTKGIKGRGLGLYITRQLLERYEYEINFIRRQKNRLLKGANFIVSFPEEDIE